MNVRTDVHKKQQCTLLVHATISKTECNCSHLKLIMLLYLYHKIQIGYKIATFEIASSLLRNSWTKFFKFSNVESCNSSCDKEDESSLLSLSVDDFSRNKIRIL